MPYGQLERHFSGFPIKKVGPFPKRQRPQQSIFGWSTIGSVERNGYFDTMLPCVTFLAMVTKLYPEKWTWILQLPMFVDSETVVWTPKVPRIPIV